MTDGNVINKASMALGIRLLGRLEVICSGSPVPLPPSKKTRALLAYLVATHERQSRAHLCELLWEGPDDPRAALRWSLTKIRSLLDDGPPRLLSLSRVVDRRTRIDSRRSCRHPVFAGRSPATPARCRAAVCTCPAGGRSIFRSGTHQRHPPSGRGRPHAGGDPAVRKLSANARRSARSEAISGSRARTWSPGVLSSDRYFHALVRRRPPTCRLSGTPRRTRGRAPSNRGGCRHGRRGSGSRRRMDHWRTGHREDAAPRRSG